MTERNFEQELSNSIYYHMKNGNDTESIDYLALLGVITEMMNRIEQLEKKKKKKLSLLKLVENSND